jgi:hypothetical protein
MFTVIEKQKRHYSSPRWRWARHNGSHVADGSAAQKLLHFCALRRQKTWIMFLAIESQLRVKPSICRSYTAKSIPVCLLAPNLALFLGQHPILVLMEHARIWQSDKLVE